MPGLWSCFAAPSSSVLSGMRVGVRDTSKRHLVSSQPCIKRGQNMQLRCARSPERTAAALQVQQSPWSSTCPTHYAESVGVVVESRGRIALALAQRENSTVGSPKSAVSPRPPRRNSGAARTAPFGLPTVEFSRCVKAKAMRPRLTTTTSTGSAWSVWNAEDHGVCRA